MDRSFNYIISPEISEFRRFSPKLKIGVLASGKGTNFQELINLSEKGELDIDIKVLITNKDDAGCIKRAESNKIPHRIIRIKDFHQKEALELAKDLISWANDSIEQEFDWPTLEVQEDVHNGSKQAEFL